MCIHLEENVIHEYNIIRRWDMAWQGEEIPHTAICLFSKTWYLVKQYRMRSHAVFTYLCKAYIPIKEV